MDNKESKPMSFSTMRDVYDYIESRKSSPANHTEYCPQHGYPLPCAKCGAPKSGHYGDETPETHYLHAKSDEELRELIAKWLFKNRHRLPNQRFYANWYDETAASPLTEKEYLNLANELLTRISAHNKDKADTQSCQDCATVEHSEGYSDGYKAGYKVGYKQRQLEENPLIQQGMQKVVEWIEVHSTFHYPKNTGEFNLDDWYYYLKNNNLKAK